MSKSGGTCLALGEHVDVGTSDEVVLFARKDHGSAHTRVCLLLRGKQIANQSKERKKERKKKRGKKKSKCGEQVRC